MSAQGRDFLIAALDPMHDNQLHNLAGWPDMETSPSVVRLIKQSITITMPTTPGNYDVYFISWPWINGATFVAGNRTNNVIQTGNIALLSQLSCIGGVSVFIVPTGQPFLLTNDPDFQLTIDQRFLSGSNRIVGSGFEIVNTTADLYRQGQLCVWRETASPVAPFHCQVNTTSPSENVLKYLGYQTRLFPSPPRSFASAMLLPGTRQWRAEDGCYVVTPHSNSYNPSTLPDYSGITVQTTETDDIVPSGVQDSWNTFWNVAGCLTTAFDDNGVAGAGNIRYSRPQHVYPVHMTGSIFTGVSEKTTLTLSWNLFLETFPTPADAEILVLAKPSAEPDPMAIKLYSECMSVLPVGVMASENPFGEWFADVVSTITDFLTPGALAMGMPGLAALSKGANVMSKNYLDKTKREQALITAPSPQSLSLRDVRKDMRKQLNSQKPPRRKKPKKPRKKQLVAVARP